MKFTKHFTRREAIPGGVILCCLVLMAAVFFFPGDPPEQENARYSGKNGSVCVQFTRYRDYDVFLEKKSPYIWIYNSREELKDVKGFIVGEVSLDGHWEDVSRCDIQLVRGNGESADTIAFVDIPDRKVNLNFPFTIYDYYDPGRNLYKTAIVRLEEKNIEIPVNLE
ncbi:hypothetical protein ACRQU7_18670 [Caproiciproducens sp. R1]|uniref:hypothetical protein n=1 Tax=Caproiciproducens sp. R1 TaxID=3435000 RepID=UPI004034316B